MRPISCLAVALLLLAPVTVQGNDPAPLVTGELRVRAGVTTLWIDEAAVVEALAPGDVRVVLGGRTSRNLESVQSWVPDDAFGEVQLTGPRRFELVLRGGHEINTALSGMPIFVTFHTTSGELRDYTARIELVPRLVEFTGPTEISVEEDLRPIYVRDPGNPLRYRGEVTTRGQADDLTVYTASNSNPEVARLDSNRWRFDWTYDQLERAGLAADELVYVTAVFGRTAVTHAGSIGVQTRALELTTEDPHQVWPERGCEPAVWQCIQDHSDRDGLTDGLTDDLAACGDYREVQRCLAADRCERDGAQPVSLRLIDVGALRPAVRAYDQACRADLMWCSLDQVRAHAVAAQPGETATLSAIVSEVIRQDRTLAGLECRWGTVYDRAGLAKTPLFGTRYSLGPALLAAADAVAQDSKVEAWLISDPVPCHNCTEFRDTAVLWYPATSTVIVLQGTHGFDS